MTDPGLTVQKYLFKDPKKIGVLLYLRAWIPKLMFCPEYNQPDPLLLVPSFTNIKSITAAGQKPLQDLSYILQSLPLSRIS